jgi:hypothetical protein
MLPDHWRGKSGGNPFSEADDIAEQENDGPSSAEANSVLVPGGDPTYKFPSPETPSSSLPLRPQGLFSLRLADGKTFSLWGMSLISCLLLLYAIYAVL